eukprot:CAMPEP_0202469680 /NCGR_PEP_ID=MMETSP1360-20130828/79204_1 /ASSEMBLY_ACC=CAM_ASM_000848 /TAXON_ID=515479 /ORGANISM="Licmophora paradoxa, Strain CCMP2313" /LENGTH=65 /DNA_ID=CAMNT_0049095097 /DNA_START=36 /DNA_END=230 /DNA_ORIENTATION=-
MDKDNKHDGQKCAVLFDMEHSLAVIESLLHTHLVQIIETERHQLFQLLELQEAHQNTQQQQQQQQ